jgi:hypothetical protein
VDVAGDGGEEAELAGVALHGLLVVDPVALQDGAGLGQLLGAHLVAAQAQHLVEDGPADLVDAAGRQAHPHHQEAGVAGGEDVGRGGGGELAVAHHLEVEPGAVALPQHHRQQVEGRNVGVVDGRGAEAEQDLRLLDVTGARPQAQGRLVGLLGAAGEAVTAAHRGESGGDGGAGSGAVEVADDHQGDVAGHVVTAEEGEQVVAAQGADRLLRADDGAAVGVDVEGAAEERLGGHPVGVVEPLLDLLEDDVALALELDRVEAGVHQRVGQDVHAGVEELAGQDQVVDGLVIAGPGVDLAAGRLDLLGDLAHPALARPLEQHVLEDVGDAGQRGGLVGGADLHPGLEGHHRSGVVLFQDHLEAIVETKCHRRFSPVRA